MHIYDALDDLEKMLGELDALMAAEGEVATQEEKDRIEWKQRKIAQSVEKWYNNREDYSWDGVAEDTEAAEAQTEKEKLSAAKEQISELMEKFLQATQAGDEVSAMRIKKELDDLQL